MPEDKLTHDERLRLECIAQANLCSVAQGGSAEQIVEIAKHFETYIKEGSH